MVALFPTNKMENLVRRLERAFDVDSVKAGKVVTFKLSYEALKIVETLRRKLGITRSQLIRRALYEFVLHHIHLLLS